ncbi:TetR/AcrR family transcriptional regulator [Herbiconiux liangxiaofengii]|uniref:TetR/AcrR family transcriptional regulator n=1 Tax=Herbiconiux liangxiaofengii TaxID=3342795 RepID=UPI0035B92418
MTDPVTRVPGPERRALTIEAATGVFAARGYFGASTDQIARVAGISQPYVVRMFGGKEALFIEVIRQSLDRIMSGFRAALEENPAQPLSALGAAYVTLAQKEQVHLILLQAFAASADPAVGPAARAGFEELLDFLLHTANLSADEAETFLARGMLINTVMAIDLPTGASSDAKDLIARVLKSSTS